MAVTCLYPTLMVEDVARTVDFYREVLGFAFVAGEAAGTGAPVPDWPAATALARAEVAGGKARLAFETRASLAAALPGLANAKRGGSLVLVMECDDLDALCARISELVPLLKAPHRSARGLRQCSLQDPDGYILTFAQRPDAPAPTPETIP